MGGYISEESTGKARRPTPERRSTGAVDSGRIGRSNIMIVGIRTEAVLLHGGEGVIEGLEVRDPRLGVGGDA